MTTERVDVLAGMWEKVPRGIVNRVAGLMASADKVLDANSIRQLGDALNELDAALNACRADSGDRT